MEGEVIYLWNLLDRLMCELGIGYFIDREIKSINIYNVYVDLDCFLNLFGIKFVVCKMNGEEIMVL